MRTARHFCLRNYSSYSTKAMPLEDLRIALAVAEAKAVFAEKERLDERIRLSEELRFERNRATKAESMLQVESLALLRARNSLNLRGALELAAERLVGRGGISRKIFGVGVQLASLTESKEWLDEVGKIRRNTAVLKDIIRAQNNLCHSYSKDKHGVTETICLDSVESAAEKVAIAATLKLANIHFD